jgi:hypothetical protein
MLGIHKQCKYKHLLKSARGYFAGVNKERRTRNADHPGKIPTPLSRCIPSGQFSIIRSATIEHSMTDIPISDATD